MDTKAFLASVVPWDLGGYVTIHWHRTGWKSMPGRSCPSIEVALELIDDLLVSKEVDIYFCLSHQRLNSGQRSRENAVGFNSLWMDLDVKANNPKNYGSIPEALASLFAFCDFLSIPRPSVLIFSGGGIHAYWFSDRTLTVEEWQPYADALKAAARTHNLKIDAGVTGDAARVLRVPGTKNWKYPEGPRPVRVAEKYSPGTRYEFGEAFKKILLEYRPSGFRPSGQKPKVGPKIEVAEAFKDIDSTSLGEGITPREIPPLPLQPILDECGWLRHAYETGGETHDEPQWRLALLCLTFVENGHELAHHFGHRHPDYNFESTEDKWGSTQRQRAAKDIGWPRCQTVRDAGSPHCAGCPHLQKEQSPLNLGYAALGDPVEKEMAELGGTRPTALRLPEGFCCDKKGRICAFVRAKKLKSGIQPARLVRLFKTVIRDPSMQHQNGQYGIGFTAKTDRFGTAEVFLYSGNCFEAGLFKHLRDNCVMYEPGKEAKLLMEQFAPAWLDLLLDDVAVSDSGTMGWRYKDGKRVGFAYGSTLYREDGTEVPLIAVTDDDFRSHYTPQGSREPWIEACKLLTDRKRPELDALIAIGFAAPLMVFAGTLYGSILSVWGEPGTSKSTAQQVAAAVWGHPKQTRESLNSTPKSVQRRLGKTKNLAAYWDDIQDERHQDALFQTMFVATQGTEGGRLNTDATMKERLDWQTLLVACSNTSFVEYLIRKQKSTTAGMRRVFEIEFNKKEEESGMINASDAGKVFAKLEHHFGVIGAEYARILAVEHNEIDEMVSATMKDFMARVDGSGDESYWWGMCGVLIAGAKIARRLGADLDIEALEYLLECAFIHNRTIRGTEGTEGGSYDNTVMGLTAFLNFYIGSRNLLVVDRLWWSRHVKVTPIQEPMQGHPIYVQLARDERKLLFSKRAIREFLHKNDIQSRQIFTGMEKFFKAKDVRATLGAGTVLAQTQELCVEILVQDKYVELQELLNAQGPPKP